MTSDLVRNVSQLVAETETTELTRVLTAIRDLATDARKARRVIERGAPGSLRVPLTDVLGQGDFAHVLDLLEACVRAVEATRRRLGTTNLVWTGPSTKAVRARPTRAVVLEMIGRSHTSLTLSTYAGHDIADLVKAVDDARLTRGVHVRVIVETPGDSATGDGPDPTIALKHLPLAVPVYRWPKDQRGAQGGAMHVKCVIRDAEEVLITSANLTSAALDRNMELGLGVEGGDAARRLEQHYDDLIDAGVLVRIS